MLAQNGARLCGRVVIELWEFPNMKSDEDGISYAFEPATGADSKTLVARVAKAFPARVARNAKTQAE